MGWTGKSLAAVVGVALLALGAWSPTARSDEPMPAGRGASLGVSTRNLSFGWRNRHDYHGGGVLVVNVDPGSPADMAGIVPGDVLVNIDSKAVREPQDVSEAESGLEPGRTVSVVLARDGGRSIKIVNLTTGRATESAPERAGRRAPESVPVPPAPGREQVGAAGAQDPATGSQLPSSKQQAAAAAKDASTELGVRCESLTPELADALGAPDAHGVLVLDVKGEGVAQKAGIRAGDVILQVGGQPVADQPGLDQAIAGAPSQVAITTLRHRTPQEVQVELAGHPAAVSPAAPAEADGGNGDVWRDRMLLELRDQVRQLTKEVQELRAQLARGTRQ